MATVCRDKVNNIGKSRQRDEVSQTRMLFLSDCGRVGEGCPAGS